MAGLASQLKKTAGTEPTPGVVPPPPQRRTAPPPTRQAPPAAQARPSQPARQAAPTRQAPPTRQAAPVQSRDAGSYTLPTLGVKPPTPGIGIKPYGSAEGHAEPAMPAQNGAQRAMMDAGMGYKGKPANAFQKAAQGMRNTPSMERLRELEKQL